MDPDTFLQELQQRGFESITTVTREPHGALGTHTHPFEARALILSGEIRIGNVLYRPGDVFHLECNEPHAEQYGPDGVSYLVGRKSPHPG